MKKRVVVFVLAAAMVAGLSACGGSSGSSAKEDPVPPTSPPAGPAPLSVDEYNQLSPLQQYQVTNRLLSALFKGVPALEFFAKGTVGADVQKLVVSDRYRSALGEVRNALETPLDRNRREAITTLIDGDPDNGVPAKYNFDVDRRPMQYESAYLFEMPLSDEYFARWMAYKLTNTILISPAEEMDSATERDVQRVYEGLVSALMVDTPIQQIVASHEKSQANWRRFRSPEENTRAMIEIFLGLVDRDADVPKAATACKNWSLSDEDAFWELIISPKVNTVPQQILDTYVVTTCEDFYSTIANHPLLIPQITTVLVEHLFGSRYDAAARAQLVQEIVSSEPTTFRQIFLEILFSKQFLLHAERERWFEEIYFNIASRLYWRPYAEFFRDLNRTAANGANIGGATLPLMYQPAFSLKWGRPSLVPVGVLGFSYQHNGLRSALLTRSNAKLWTDPTYDPAVIQSQGWGPELIENTAGMEIPDFINYMFISVAGRAATAEEVSVLTQVIMTARTANTASIVDCSVPPVPGCLNFFSPQNSANRAMVVMDYLSRLPEMYYFNAVQ